MRQTFDAQLESDDSSSDSSGNNDYCSDNDNSFEANKAPVIDPIDGHLTDQEFSDDSADSDNHDPFKIKSKAKKVSKVDQKLLDLKKSIKVVFMALNPDMSFDQFLKYQQ